LGKFKRCFWGRLRPALHLSDPIAEETLYDSEAIRQFAGIELGDDRIPDETTILNFRHLLEKHHLTGQPFAEVNRHLADQGITLRSGTLVDATIIDAPSSTKDEAGTRDPAMSSTKKGNQWYFGLKAHVMDTDSGIVHSLETTTAKVHDSQVWDAPLHGEETSVWAERGYVSVAREAACHAQGAQRWRTAPCRRGHQPDHRQGSRPGRASLPGDQASVRVSGDPVPWPCQDRAQLFTPQQ
jgi:IS5 family transposase